MSLHKDQQLKVHVCSWMDRGVVCLANVAPQRRGSTAKIILLCSDYFFFCFSVSV